MTAEHSDTLQAYLTEGREAGSRYALVQPPGAPLGVAGSELGNRPGASLEFMDHREYLPGDDLRRIDWSAYARSDKLTVKLYREEVCPHLDLLIDASASMALPNTAKLRATVAMSALLATAAENAGYSHAAYLAADGCHKIPNSSAAPPLWQGLRFDHTTGADDALLRLPPPWRPRGIRVLISDLLWMADPLVIMPQIAAKAACVVVVQLLARTDVDPPRHGNIRLVDAETSAAQEIFIDASAQKRYRDALSRHQQNWHRACKQVGAAMTTVVAEEIVTSWQLDALLALEILKVA